MTTSTETKNYITRAEALHICECVNRTVPNSRIERNAWNISVLSSSGRIITSYLGRKDGFRKQAILGNSSRA